MNTGKIIVITLLAGIVSVGAGVMSQKYLNPPTPDAGPPSLIPQPMQTLKSLPDFSYPRLDGQTASSKQWAGKVLVLNFWATWCPPCRKEMPAFMTLQDELGAQGLQFVGIAIDTADAVKAFSDELGINYPILLGGEDAIELSKRLGNRFQGLPFSVIFDRKGKIAHVQNGELLPETIREKIDGLL